jgi:catechol 2,3-dioxygenase-like lactoylglutathione lyase family enzyme
MVSTNGLKEATRVTAPVASNTLNVNVFTAPGKSMVGERPKPFGEALGFDPITSTLIFGEYDAVLGAPGYLQLANIWMILNVGGGPTPDKPTVTLSVPDPNHINSFMNFRVADIQACYKLWKSRGAEFITEPIPKYGETRCYIRDPDGYIIEVGQSTTVKYG